MDEAPTAYQRKSHMESGYHAGKVKPRTYALNALAQINPIIQTGPLGENEKHSRI